MSVARSIGGRRGWAIAAALSALAPAACGVEQDFLGTAAPGEAPGAWSTSGVAAISAAGPGEELNACMPTGAHGKHAAQGYGCALCHHPCGGGLAFGLVTFPGGATTADGTISPAGLATTCWVRCHSPLGAPSQPVAWNEGPLACTSCHSNVVTATTPIRSSHLGASGIAGTTCASCHDLSQHTSGQVRLLNADGTSTSSTCVECHRGQGQTLAGATPPLLVGWDDAVSGDFHGPRPGTCRFDALDAEGQRTTRGGGMPCPPGQPAPPGAPHHLAVVVPDPVLGALGMDVRHRDGGRERRADRPDAHR